MLLDTASLYFRAFYGVPDSIRAPDGTPVNAVRGLLDFIARLLTDRRPDGLVACLDADWRPAFRVAAIASYKAHRVAADGGEDVPPALAAQVPVILELLRALGVAAVGVPGYEADDVIGAITARAPGPVDIVTGDRDLFQLVDDARGVRVLYTASRGVGRAEVVDEAAVAARYGIPARAYADFALLRGDPSDGLPGVPGVGEKTAATLLSTHGDLPGVLGAAIDPDSGMSPALRRKLAAASAYLSVAPAVVRVAVNAPLPEYVDQVPRVPADPAAVRALADRWGLGSSLERVLTAMASLPQPSV
jgi:5'-3' exonuclease